MGDGFAYDRADLVNPVLVDENGEEVSLLTLTPSSYKSDWGSLHTNKNVEGKALKVDGVTYETGLGMNAQCTLIYDLPAGHKWKTLRAVAMIQVATPTTPRRVVQQWNSFSM